MAVIYVKEQGAMIQKRGERIIISKGSGTLLEIPLIQMENLALIGNVQITTQALHMLMEQGVDVLSLGIRFKTRWHLSEIIDGRTLFMIGRTIWSRWRDT